MNCIFSIFRKLWHALNADFRRWSVVLLGLMLIGMVLEAMGIGLIIPLVTLMTQSDLTARYPVLAPLLNSLGNPSQEWLVTAGMLMLVGVYAVKALFLAFLAWQQACFVYGLQDNLSHRHFAGYLYQPYTFHLQRNSAQLIRNTIAQVGGISNVTQQSLTLITEALVMFGISALLLAVEPVGTLLVVSTLGLAGWIFSRFTRSHSLRWGEAHQRYEGMRIQHLQQGLGGVKEVKLLGREGNFLDRYQMNNAGSARVGRRLATVLALPRLWLEVLAISGLAALILVMVSQGKPVELLLPTLALFAAAAFRIMPSVSRVIGIVQALRFALPIIETMDSELSSLEAVRAPQRGHILPFNKALTLHKVSFQYPAANVLALREISLVIPHGSSVGFIGGSGAGKSTLVDIILGLLTPDSGSVRVDGVDIQTNIRGWQDQIGYVPQSIYLTDDTLRRNVAFGIPDDQIDESAIIRAIHAAHLEQFVNGLPQGLDTEVGEHGIRISGGQRQRIGIARSLYHDPPVLVLDEATSSLDTTTEYCVMDAVRALKGNKTIIIVAHRLSTVECCDQLFRLEQGRLVEEGEARVVLNKVVGSTGY